MRSEARERAVLGTAVLVLAMALFLVMPQWFDRGTPGSARPIDIPSPPAVGSCLATDQAMSVVPCTGPHDAEVAVAWPWSDPLVATVARFSGYLDRPYAPPPDVSMGGLPEEIISSCWTAVQTFVNPLSATADQRTHWLPVSPRVLPAIITAPPDQGSGRWRWMACVVATSGDDSWSGSLRWQAAAPPSRPGALSASCQSDGAGSFSACNRPHRTEVLGWPAYGRLIETDNLSPSCLELAQLMTGRDDPTFDGRIAITVIEHMPVPYNSALPLCAAALVGDGTLTDSLIGIGDADLPIG